MDPNQKLLQIVKESTAVSTIVQAEAEKKVPSGLRPKKSSSAPPVSRAPVNSLSRPREVLEPDTRNKSDSQMISSTLLERFCENILPWRLGTQEDAESDARLHLDNYLPDSFSSAAEYIDRWEPLFLEETRASIVSNLPTTRQLPCAAVKLCNGDPTGQLMLTRLECVSIPGPPEQTDSTSAATNNSSSSSGSTHRNLGKGVTGNSSSSSGARNQR